MKPFCEIQDAKPFRGQAPCQLAMILVLYGEKHTVYSPVCNSSASVVHSSWQARQRDRAPQALNILCK